MALPRRKNADPVDCSWWNVLAAAIDDNEKKYDISDNQAPTPLSGQSFDGTAISSVPYEYEIVRGETVFANGRFVLQYKNGTWKKIEQAYTIEEEDLEHGVTFTVDQDGPVVDLLVATDEGAGPGTLKLRRKPFYV